MNVCIILKWLYSSLKIEMTVNGCVELFKSTDNWIIRNKTDKLLTLFSSFTVSFCTPGHRSTGLLAVEMFPASQ